MRFLLGIRKGENESKSIHSYVGEEEEERRGAKERQMRKGKGEGLYQLG